jgi:hypothetical protein
VTCGGSIATDYSDNGHATSMQSGGQAALLVLACPLQGREGQKSIVVRSDNSQSRITHVDTSGQRGNYRVVGVEKFNRRLVISRTNVWPGVQRRIVALNRRQDADATSSRQ